MHLATTTELAVLGPNVRQGTNDYGITGYTGPCPTLSTLSIAQSGGTYDPMSHIYTGVRVLAHGYAIKVYALDKEARPPGRLEPSTSCWKPWTAASSPPARRSPSTAPKALLK